MTLQLMQPQPIWALGNNPFAWNPLTDEQEQQIRSSFITSLVDADPKAPHDYISAALLEER